jgi:protein-S-isoprenylcysteine O-methyltransferase Ste14
MPLPDLRPDLIAVALATAAWCGAHSWFVSHTWRDLVRRRWPRIQVFSRLLYVTFSLLSLGLLMYWIRTLPAELLFDWPGWWAPLRWLGLVAAVVLFWLGSRHHDNRSFLGWTQVREYLAGRTPREPRLQAGGILGVIRHPWYTGTLFLLVFCLPFTDVNLVWRGVFLVYTLVGTELEERKLLKDFGESYAAYRARVPRYFPDPRHLMRPPRK